MDHALHSLSLPLPVMPKHLLLARSQSLDAGKYGPNLVGLHDIPKYRAQAATGPRRLSVGKLFGLHISSGTDKPIQGCGSANYQGTYDDLLKRLCSGRLLHVDETSVSVKGKNGYVWVLTSMEEVAYFYTPTRAGDTIQAMLKDFSGSWCRISMPHTIRIECPQQKCLIHFIRDLNDELLKHPYDDELKRLGGAFASLVKPMIETVDRHGLKKRFLRKHRIFVDRFYNRLSGGFGTGEAATKNHRALAEEPQHDVHVSGFRRRAWNNNNAEHAMKAFATLRRVIEGSTTTERGLRDYFILLSLCETCKYKNVDFLGFPAIQFEETSISSTSVEDDA